MARLQKGVFHSERPASLGGRSITHGNRKSSRPFDCGGVDEAEVWEFVKTVVEAGDNVCFTLTSDGGALCICVLAGTTRHKAYASTPEDLLEKFTMLREEVY